MDFFCSGFVGCVRLDELSLRDWLSVYVFQTVECVRLVECVKTGLVSARHVMCVRLIV